MNKTEVEGVRLIRLEDPIRTALDAYQDLSGGRFTFDLDAACVLKLTPDKPNSARSTTEAKWNGEEIGKLSVIVFKSGDGTGDEKTYQLPNLSVSGQYPRDVKIVPRSKAGVFSETHLTIATHEIGNGHAEPQLYMGTLDLLGFPFGPTVVMKLGQLGQSEGEIANFDPTATLTVGYEKGVRFGDPHAVYNRIPHSLQVCAFLAISDKVQKIHPNILDSLHPKLPFPVEVV